MVDMIGSCEVCSAYWVTGIGRAVTIGESEEYMAEVRRCRYCGAYWEVGAFSVPKVLTREQALRELPDLDVLELKLGIDFSAQGQTETAALGIVVDQELSQAIVEYLGRGRSSFPISDEEAVVKVAGDGDPAVLLAKVRAIESECLSVYIDWTTLTLEQAGWEAERVMRARHPELSRDAVDALRWGFTYNWR